MNTVQLGHKIRQFRMRAGLSQMELELEIDASPGSLSRIESNQVNPTKETLQSLSKALNLSSIESASFFNLNIQTAHTIEQLHLVFTDMIKELPTDVLNSSIIEAIIVEYLNQLERIVGGVGTSLSLVSKDANTLRLMYLSESWLPKMCKLLFFNSESYLPVSLSLNSNFTINAVRNNQIIIDSNLSKFIVPPLDPKFVPLIKSFIRSTYMSAVPVSCDREVIGVINIGFTGKESPLLMNKLIAIQIQSNSFISSLRIEGVHLNGK